jgi:class 3 adenylate cyclase/TolB-like protein/Tfp pilus assembly protein PilF
LTGPEKQERLTRRLAAILVADIAGYSRLMNRDEERTHRRAHEILQRCVEPQIARHKGRIVKNTGDGFLAEFASVVDGVTCAMDIQDAVAAVEREVPDDDRIRFRIGVNVGDVIVENDDIFGDGVNIAARLQTLAEPGTVAISSKVKEEIAGRLAIVLEDLGSYSVKNIAKPVHVYRAGRTRARFAWLRRLRPQRPFVAAGVAGLALVAALVAVVFGAAVFFPTGRIAQAVAAVPLLARIVPLQLGHDLRADLIPSLAVMPFENLTGDKSLGYVADGLSENITSALSKLSNMVVVSRYSVRGYKEKEVPVQQIGREQRVKYVLAAALQRSANRFRLTAQLVEAESGRVVWSDRYDYETSNVLGSQDDIARNVVTALRVSLNEGEQARAFGTQTRNFDAWGYAMRGYIVFENVGPDANAESRQLFLEAIRSDPSYGMAWTYLAANYALAARFGFGPPQEMLGKAFEAANRAIALDPNIPDAHSTLGSLYLFSREYAKAIDEGRKAVALGPSDAEVNALLGQTLFYDGQDREAVILFERAERLSPRCPSWFLIMHANALISLGEPKAAAETAKRAMERAEGPFNRGAAELVLAVALAASGNLEDARRHSASAYPLYPRGVTQLTKASLLRDPTRIERNVAVLRLIGWPE